MYSSRWAPLGLAVAALGTAGLTLANASPASTFATRDQLAAAPLPAPGQVAFASDRPSLGIPTPAADGSDARIWVSASPLTSPLGAPAQLTIEPRGTQDRDPDWSPDGTQVAFASGEPLSATGDPRAVTAAIKVIDLRTHAVRTLADAQAGQDFPAFSPDGAQVAFVADDPVPGDAGEALFLKAANGQSPARLLAVHVEGKPSWSPDGSTIYFTRAAAHGREIWKVGPVGSATRTEQRVVTSSDAPDSQGVDNFDPAVSPDGGALCYSRTVPSRAVPELARFDLATSAITSPTPMAAPSATTRPRRRSAAPGRPTPAT
jgi:WD40 repeat protein